MDNSDAVKLNDFPNEILVEIFQNLTFVDRRQMTEVCHRWNQLIFRFFGDGFLSKLDKPLQKRLGLLTGRNYRNISLFLDDYHDGWNVTFHGEEDKLSFLHLDVSEGSSKIFEEFRHLLPKFVNLRTFNVTISEEDFKVISDVIFKLTSIESLKITFKVHVRSLRLLEGLHRMSRLRNIKLAASTFSYPRNFHISPVPQLINLEFRRILAANFRNYSLAFPNLTVLDILSMKRSDEMLLKLVKAWPKLEVLTLRINLGFLKNLDLRILQSLSKMRKLSLLDVASQLPETTTSYLRSIGNEQPSFSTLDAIFDIPTLKELHVDGKWTGLMPTVNPDCRLFMNGVYRSR